MIQGIFQSTTLPALEQMAMFSERRHEVLAGNMANLDTPDYRARDLSVTDFEHALATAIEKQRKPETHAYRSPGYLSSSDLHPALRSNALNSPGEANMDPFEGPRLAMEKLVYHDGSDVNWETQITELSKNQSMHNMAIALMRSQFSTLNAAISERV
jgi:flagellar basal-body rod protein FlgB